MTQAVRVIHAFQHYRVGDVIHPVGLFRSHLVSGGFVEIVKDAEITPRQPEHPKPAKTKAK